MSRCTGSERELYCVYCRQLMDSCLSSSVTQDVSSMCPTLSLLYSTNHRSRPW